MKLRNKSFRLPDKSRILKAQIRDEFSIKANDVRFQITQLRDLLIENRSAYMRLGYHLKSLNQMTDKERDTIDEESETIINLCSQFLKDLETECHKNGVHSKKQTIQHKLGILDILSNYLNNVFRIYNEQKKYRIKHEIDTYKFLSLASNDVSTSTTHPNQNKFNTYTLTSNNHGLIEEDQDQPSDSGGVISDERFSSDDIQMLESENVQLLNNFATISDEVEQIEKNVFGIAKLQEIFTEKVS